MSLLAVAALVPLLAAQTPGSAVVPTDTTNAALEDGNAAFRKGDFREAIGKYEEARRGTLKDPGQRFRAALYQGLAHFYLGEAEQARTFFTEVLLANPDYELDPLTFGDEAHRALDKVRASPELAEPLRQRREEIKEAKAREAEARRLIEEAERRRRELAALPERLPSIERHNPLLNVLPFGVPQIEQQRVTTGVLFAVAQGASLTATVLTYTQVQSYIESNGRIASGNFAKAKNWRLANWIAVGVAAAVYVGGVVDAFVHYHDRTITLVPREEYLKLKQQEAPAASPKPSATLFLAPTPGGAAVGVAGAF